MKSQKLALFFACASLAAQAGQKRLNGTIEGFGQLRSDDILDGALVLPTLRPGALLAFQFENLLGPSEQMSAGPLTVEVPGNFYFPSQRESYGFFPITLVKQNFGLYLDPQQDEELHALSFQAPFSKLVDMAQNKKAFTSMLPFLKLKKASFEGNRTWPDATNLKMTLNRSFQASVPYVWTKKAPPSDGVDTIITFQSTPAGRWAVSDINGKPANQGSLSLIEGLGSQVKTFFIRAFTRAGEQAPYAVVGQIRAGQNGRQIEASDVPEKISQLRIEGQDYVAWDPIQRDGWISVVRSGDSKPMMMPQSFALDFSFGLSHLPILEEATDWIRPQLGGIKLARPVAAGESLLVVFVGTSRPVTAPSIEDQNPDLFTFAEEIRMATIKK